MPSILSSKSQGDTDSPYMEPIRGTGLLGKGKAKRQLFPDQPIIRSLT
jgi:hypothetical protein